MAPKEKEDALGMVAPPSGTVTFLFTDIEGSSRMSEKCAKTMRTALARHDEVLRSAIEANGGHVFTEKLAAYRTAGAQRILLWPVNDELHQLEAFRAQVAPLANASSEEHK